MYENFFLKIPFVTQGLIDNVVGVLLSVGPIFLLLILINICWKTWLGYKRFEFITKQNRILLELRLPKEIKKTPLAMELFLNAIHQTGGEGTWYARDFQGKARTWFSLEIVSIGGQVKFFIWTEKFYKNFLESQIYAQYPGVEIYEVPDYTKSVQLDFNKVSAWGSEFILTKADPYPIKTYIDYKLDKEGIKDEEKSDPMSPVIELLGSIEKGEQIWIQILVRAHKKEYKKSLSFEDKIKKMSDIRTLVMTSIISALALVVGLFWNEAIKAAIEQIVPQGEGLFYKFLAALIVTIVVVIVIYVIIHSQRLAEKRLKELESMRLKLKVKKQGN